MDINLNYEDETYAISGSMAVPAETALSCVPQNVRPAITAAAEPARKNLLFISIVSVPLD